jgi:hypothetical protein
LAPTAPPPSIGMLMSMPNSRRLVCAVAEKPSPLCAPLSGPNPFTLGGQRQNEQIADRDRRSLPIRLGFKDR